MKYRDLHELPEDGRIRQIGQHVMGTHGQVSFITDDTEGKADRYVRKLIERFPAVEVVRQGAGPVPGTVTVVLRQRPH